MVIAFSVQLSAFSLGESASIPLFPRGKLFGFDPDFDTDSDLDL